MSSEIDLLRQRKAVELRRKMLLAQQKAEPTVEQPKPNPTEVLKNVLTGRGLEVLDTARRYYPNQVRELETSLAEFIQSGRLKGPISGEELYAFLRRVGLAFNMDTKIQVKEHGQLKSLEEKFRSISR